MSKKKTLEDFTEELRKKYPHIDITGDYVTARTKTDFFCNIHNYSFSGTPDSVLRTKYGCSKCARENEMLHRKKTNKQFVEELKNALPTVIPLEEYVTARNKTKVKCSVCGNIWYSAPYSLLKGNGCKKCAMKYVQNLRIKTHEQFLNDVRKRNINHNKFMVVSKYIKNDLPVTCECLDCHRQWNVVANNLLGTRGGSACPYCNLSKGEASVRNFLEKHNVDFEAQKTFDGLYGLGGGSLRYDFYLPSYNLLIEYQGEFHDGTPKYQTKSGLEYQQEHDRRKRNYAQNNNIELLEIWYKDYDNIDTILSEKLSV